MIDSNGYLVLDPVRSILWIAPQFAVHLSAPQPNRWRRLWYRLLLGWTWESV